jgi:hypothetical protein
MSSVLIQEGLIRLTTAARLLPDSRNGRGLHPATLTRWCTIGVKDRSGRRVKLEAVKVGQAWQTSRQAVARFLEALAEEPAPGLGALAQAGQARGHSAATERALDAIFGPTPPARPAPVEIESGMNLEADERQRGGR